MNFYASAASSASNSILSEVLTQPLQSSFFTVYVLNDIQEDMLLQDKQLLIFPLNIMLLLRG